MHSDHRSPASVALTFDDGPEPVWTPLVLDALANAGAQVTFFVIAPRATRYPSLISSMRERGHDVAFHCSDHVRHTMTRGEIEADVESGLVAVGAVLENPVGPHHTSDRRGGKQTPARTRRLDR
jgi:peptidoglycan/xylan/chitin deacetylase (PgdA/CDA1 family)